jgi:hypothetical protein
MVLARFSESRLNTDVLRLQSSSGTRAVEVGRDGAIELAAISESTSEIRHQYGEHLRILFFSARAKRRIGRNLIGRLPHTTAHPAALAIFGATAARLLGTLGMRHAESNRLRRNWRADNRQTRAHSEQSDDE